MFNDLGIFCPGINPNDSQSRWEARWPSGRASDSGERDQGFDAQVPCKVSH